MESNASIHVFVESQSLVFTTGDLVLNASSSECFGRRAGSIIVLAGGQQNENNAQREDVGDSSLVMGDGAICR